MAASSSGDLVLDLDPLDQPPSQVGMAVPSTHSYSGPASNSATSSNINFAGIDAGSQALPQPNLVSASSSYMSTHPAISSSPAHNMAMLNSSQWNQPPPLPQSSLMNSIAGPSPSMVPMQQWAGPQYMTQMPPTCVRPTRGSHPLPLSVGPRHNVMMVHANPSTMGYPHMAMPAHGYTGMGQPAVMQQANVYGQMGMNQAPGYRTEQPTQSSAYVNPTIDQVGEPSLAGGMYHARPYMTPPHFPAHTQMVPPSMMNQSQMLPRAPVTIRGNSQSNLGSRPPHLDMRASLQPGLQCGSVIAQQTPPEEPEQVNATRASPPPQSTSPPPLFDTNTSRFQQLLQQYRSTKRQVSGGAASGRQAGNMTTTKHHSQQQTFSTSDILNDIIPIPPAVPSTAQKPWHIDVNPDLRKHLVKKLVQALIYPAQDPRKLQDSRMQSLINYSMKVEKTMLEAANNREEYYKLLVQKIYHIRRELEDRMEMQNKEKHIAAIQEAVRNKGKLDHTVMQGVFIGPARSGKSSLIKRLLKEIVNRTSSSTGVAEKVVQVNVKRSSCIATSIFESNWSRLTYSSEAVRLMTLTAKDYQNLPESNVSVNVQIQDSRASQGHPETSSEMPAGFVAPKQTFEEALRDGGVAALRQELDGSWTLYLSDTGGQMEFQEILPLLVSGPSLFFIIFPLNRDLNELFTIEYQLPDGKRSEPYQSSLTLMEAILQSLATIAAMGTFTYKSIDDNTVLKPKVLLVGTHKDLLDPATAQTKIGEIDSYLQQTIKSMSYYRDGLVEFATESQLIFTVNNLAEDDSDFACIRSRVNAIASYSEYRMSIPTHWLVFSIVIRGLTGRVISYDECRRVAQECGIDTEEELHEALWFLHTRMGVIRFFNHGDVSKIVVIDPQLLFDMITKIIIKTFTFETLTTRSYEEFKKKGIFSLDDLSRIDKTQDSLLTHSRFIELLEHLRIVVRLGDGKLLIPCVWNHADKALYPPKQHSEVPTLAIVFDCGYCPKGVTGALVKYLLTNEMESDCTWKLQTDEIFRDQVTFFVGPHLITLCMYPTHFELVCAPSANSAESICSVQDTCRNACQTIQKAIDTVSKDANLNCHCGPTFYCTLCKSHPAELVQHKGMPCQLYCTKTKHLCDLPNGYQYWLEAPPQRRPVEVKLSNATPTLPPVLKLVSPLSSQWKTLGTYLQVDQGKLKEIEVDYRGVSSDCLREMLSEWLKSDLPCPTWEMLAEEVECIDQTIAEKIRNLYCNKRVAIADDSGR